MGCSNSLNWAKKGSPNATNVVLVVVRAELSGLSLTHFCRAHCSLCDVMLPRYLKLSIQLL